jgi:hypothetical protein
VASRGLTLRTFPRCSKCRSRRKDVRDRSMASQGHYYCDGCYEQIKADRAFRERTGRRVPIW